MTDEDPAQRPTMDEVVERFAKIRNGLSSRKLRSRVVKAGDSPYGYVLRTLVHWLGEPDVLKTKDTATTNGLATLWYFRYFRYDGPSYAPTKRSTDEKTVVTLDAFSAVNANITNHFDRPRDPPVIQVLRNASRWSASNYFRTLEAALTLFATPGGCSQQGSGASES
ncbi:hypothetical protein B0H13DRAFT_1904580 [Mycena leptocephala]|nr:hypothetical protein B0H13DRAFT_1904580 [Mycena leptocephala]